MVGYVQVGDVGEVFTTPADDEVAAVVGVANVLSGVVAFGDGSLVDVTCGPITVRGLGDQGVGVLVKVLFGAETVGVFRGEPPAGSPRNVWGGTVIAIRPWVGLREIVVDCGVPSPPSSRLGRSMRSVSASVIRFTWRPRRRRCEP